MTYEILQHYWWFVISLLGGFLSFLLFVQGGQSLVFSLSKTEEEKRLLVNVFGRKWHYTFTTLVTFGGAFFASFPLFYSTSFGGAYWVWILILFSFVLQAVAYEFHSKPNNLLGKTSYRAFLFANGLIGTFVIGVAVATFFTGSDFTVNKANLTRLSAPVISSWGTAWHGLEALAKLRNLSFGLAVFFLARTLALLFFINRLKHPVLEARSRKFLAYNALPFVLFFLVFVIWTFLSEGFAVDPESAKVYLMPYKYFVNLLEMPALFVAFVFGVGAVLAGISLTLLKPAFRKGIWFSGVGVVVTVCCLFLLAGYNQTAYYPSTADLQSSLTIYNSSSSPFTLKVMAYVSLLVPVVLAYIFYAWRVLERKPMDIEELDEAGHSY